MKEEHPPKETYREFLLRVKNLCKEVKGPHLTELDEYFLRLYTIRSKEANQPSNFQRKFERERSIHFQEVNPLTGEVSWPKNA